MDTTRLVPVVMALGLAGTATTALADPVADFYKGKSLTILVGYGEGGGYDTNTRILARHYGKHIPGTPTIVVQNMPGAGSMKVANSVYNVSPKDGTVLGVFASSTALEPLFGNDAAKYDPRLYEWVGSMHRDIAACAVWKGAGQGIKTLEDLIKAPNEVVFGSTGPAAITAQHPLFIKNMFGAKIKVVMGYKGTKGVSLAMERGEVHGTCGMFESSVKAAYDEQMKNGSLNVFVQFGKNATVPYFKDATPLYKLLKTEDDVKVADVIFGQTEIARPLAAPPKTPADRVAALRKALLDAIKDPGMIADAKKVQVDFVPIPGDEVQKMFAAFYETPKPLIDKARKFTVPEN